MEDKKENKDILRWVVFGICTLVFVFILANVLMHKDMTIDKIGHNFMFSLHSKRNTKIAELISEFGSGKVTVGLTVLLAAFFWFKNKKSIGLRIALNFPPVVVLNQVAKYIVRRPRPAYRIVKETGFSFPSGHSMCSMGLYGFLIYLAYKYIDNKALKWVIIVILSVLILSVGASRVYLGVHYTSDVLGGFMLSMMHLLLFTKFTTKNK